MKPRHGLGREKRAAAGRAARAAALACLLLACPAPAAAQAGAGAGHGDLRAFMDTLVGTGERFERVETAIAEGYRKLGPDFPGMGEHWVQPGLVIAGEVDPRRPPVIAYTTRSGERVLVGFAFTRVLGPGEEVPRTVFPASAWHDHTGGVDEESLLLSGPASMHPREEGFRLSMVHVWTHLPNPEHPLAQNNWALPFFRAGVAAPDSVSSDAARALSLAGIGLVFYERLLREGLEMDDEVVERAMEVFSQGAVDARAWLTKHRGAGRDAHGLDAELRPLGTDVAALESIWADVWAELERKLPRETYRDMQMLRGG